jgi:ribosomal protein S27E
MPDMRTTHEDLTIALRRAVADKHPSATETWIHEHEGVFIGLTFASLTGGGLRGNYYWIDTTGAMPERPRYTRREAANVLLPRAERAAALVTPDGLWTRAGEEQVSLLRPDAGDCITCGKQLADGMFRWTGRKVDPDPFEAELFSGDSRFPSLRHADGSQNHGVHDTPSAKVSCPECLRPGTTFDDGAYGTTARCPHCGWHKYTDRGD